MLGEVAIVVPAEFLDLLVLFGQTGRHSLQMDFQFLGFALVVVQIVPVVAVAAQQRIGQLVRQGPGRSNLPFQPEFVVLELGAFGFEVFDVSPEQVDRSLGNPAVLLGSIAFRDGMKQIGSHLGFQEFGLGFVLGCFGRFGDGLEEIL